MNHVHYQLRPRDTKTLHKAFALLHLVKVGLEADVTEAQARLRKAISRRRVTTASALRAKAAKEYFEVAVDRAEQAAAARHSLHNLLWKFGPGNAHPSGPHNHVDPVALPPEVQQLLPHGVTTP